MNNPIMVLDGLEGGGVGVEAQHLYTDKEIELEMQREFIDNRLYEASMRDPISNYGTEQEHFIKYAPPWEVDSWRDWNKRAKEVAYNKYSSSKRKELRFKGSIPTYIHDIIIAKDPTFDFDKAKQAAFYKRNPLFCVPEVL